MNKIIISDPTLRDGNHAIGHQLSLEQISQYAEIMDTTGVDIIEVGHGNGLGASSLQLGMMPNSDEDILKIARNKLKHAKLGVHIIPGFGTIDRDLARAIDLGVDVVRVASHCTEADITKRHIEYVKTHGKQAYGTLMMSHMAEKEVLLAESQKMANYGASAIILMDSAGAYLPDDVRQKVAHLTDKLDIPIGFHAHNNLGLAVANSIAAAESGATILDGTAKGFGAGAGNTAIEVLVSVLHKMNYRTNIDLYKLFDACDFAEAQILNELPTISTLSLVSGLYGVFSGFVKPVNRIAKNFQVDAREILRLLGENKILAGQEDLIIEFAQKLKCERDSNINLDHNEINNKCL